jgi:hypothetical protein
MRKDLRRFRQGIRDVAGTWGLASVVLLISFVFAYQFVGPAPPKRIVLATGEEGGAYRFYGEQLAAHLAREGIRTELLETAGSVENLALLDARFCALTSRLTRLPISRANASRSARREAVHAPLSSICSKLTA